MPSPAKTKSHRELMTTLFLEQAQPFLTKQPKVWAKKFGETASFSETLNMTAKAKLLPFGKSKVRTDFQIFISMPNRLGETYGVLQFFGMASKPTDFIFLLDLNLPHAAHLKKAKGMQLDDAWVSALTENGQDDPMVEALNNMERKTGLLPDKPKYHVNWTFHLGKMAVEMPYTLALMPFGDGRTIFLYKRNVQPGFFSVKKTQFGIEKVIEITEWIQESLTPFHVEGDPTPQDITIPAASLMALSEIEPLFEDQGENIPWDVNLPNIAAEPAKSPDPQSTPELASQSKFCTQCGQKLSIEAAFCSKCGAKQG